MVGIKYGSAPLNSSLIYLGFKHGTYINDTKLLLLSCTNSLICKCRFPIHISWSIYFEI